MSENAMGLLGRDKDTGPEQENDLPCSQRVVKRSVSSNQDSGLPMPHLSHTAPLSRPCGTGQAWCDTVVWGPLLGKLRAWTGVLYQKPIPGSKQRHKGDILFC